MYPHGGDDTSIVILLARRTICVNKPLPLVEQHRDIQIEWIHRFQSRDLIIGLGLAHAQSIYLDGSCRNCSKLD